MMRSKALERLRQRREEEVPVHSARMSHWQDARREQAQDRRLDLAEGDEARRRERAEAAADVHALLDDFTASREQLRLAIEMERSSHLTTLVTGVNELTAGFHADGDARKQNVLAASREVEAFLARAKAARHDLKLRQAADFRAFRIVLAQRALQACCEDFR